MNCGIAYFNMEQYARARAFFNQSQKQCSGDLYRQIESYQRKIDEQLGVQIEDSFFTLLFLHWRSFPMFFLQLFIFFLFAILLYGLYKRKKCRSLTMLLFSLFLFTIIWFQMYRVKNRIEVVANKNVVTYAGPHDSFLKKSVIPLGTVVTVIKQQDNMLQVQRDDQRGWAFIDDFIQPPVEHYIQVD